MEILIIIIQFCLLLLCLAILVWIVGCLITPTNSNIGTIAISRMINKLENGIELSDSEKNFLYYN